MNLMQGFLMFRGNHFSSKRFSFHNIVFFYVVSCAIWSWNMVSYIKGGMLRLFENRILRRILGPKRDENGEWRRLHNEELHWFYHSHNIVRVIKSRRLRLSGHVVRMKEDRSVFKILTDKPTGKRTSGRRRWEKNIRMDLNPSSGYFPYYLTLSP